MQNAMSDAQIDAQQIDYINAHGTATELNDRIESLAVERVFGEHCQNGLMMSSTKSSTGHLICASGGLEATFCALALRDQHVPATINLENTNCSKVIDYVPNQSRKTEVNYTMSNSIGFGGSNASFIFKRLES
jgi:3-oxoacyl-[acyl-carrier-protein] synthase II